MRTGLMTTIPDLSFPMGSSTVELKGTKMSVDVVFDYQPATLDTEEFQGDEAMIRIDAILLRAGLVLHDANNVMSLIVSAGTDVLMLLPERTVEKISEQVLLIAQAGT